MLFKRLVKFKMRITESFLLCIDITTTTLQQMDVKGEEYDVEAKQMMGDGMTESE